ncbi:MAG: GNAT family N-acetyltransferase, partial [Clostridia bacterium]|nr:GNAT family N-acetyltransferase [Clostridia bacterium]
YNAYTDDHQLMGSIHCLEYPLRYNGHTIRMSGIGGVGTFPQFRRRGAIRACFAEAFKDMYANGQIISQLYPFSDAFYRQFGYENAFRIHTWTIPLKALKAFPQVKGSVEMYQTGDDYAPYDEVHRKFNERFEFSAIREPIDWKHFINQIPTKVRCYTYLWRNDAGEPKAWIAFMNNNRTIDATPGFGAVRNFFFADAEGFMGMANFVKTFASNYDEWKFTVPATLPLEGFVHMHNDISIAETFRGEVRVVDAKKMLEVSPCRGTGAVSVKISDEMCPWNDGTWTVTCENDRVVSVEKTENAPDVECTAADFARLICGAMDVHELWLLPDLKVLNEKPLAHIFFRKNAFLSELF